MVMGMLLGLILVKMGRVWFRFVSISIRISTIGWDFLRLF